jgi:hypothetical protein
LAFENNSFPYGHNPANDDKAGHRIEDTCRKRFIGMQPVRKENRHNQNIKQGNPKPEKRSDFKYHI